MGTGCNHQRLCDRAPARAWWVAVASLLLILLSPSVRASCLPLSTSDAVKFDRFNDDEPDRAIREATLRLSGSKPPLSDLARAELYAVIAHGGVQASRPGEAREAIAAGMALVGRLPAGRERDHVYQRLQISNADISAQTGASDAAIQVLDALLADLPANSRERACALGVRLQAYALLNQTDRAAADGITAYRIAAAGNWIEPRIDAAYGLAAVYRRAGMLADAEKMIDEVVAYTKARGLRALLGSAQFARGQILVEEQKFPEALEALRENLENSSAVGDPVGVAAANMMTCFVHVAQKNFTAASAACRDGDTAFSTAKRMDLALTLRGVRAEVLLGQGHVEEALAGFSAVLGVPNAPLPLFVRKRLLLDQADAYTRLGRSAEAYEALHKAYVLEQDAALAQRLRTVAVLRASAESERLLVNNRLLEQRLAHQKVELATQQQLRRMSVTITAVVALVALLLAYLLVSARKHGRELRRQEAIVSTVASHAPDALVLLDAGRLVRFCNRNLFGSADSHPVGLALHSGVPAAALPALESAIEEVFAQRKTISFSVQLPGSATEQTHYELVAAPVIDGDQFLGAVLRSSDVTAVRRLEREVIDVSSRERQRLSADLHDGLGQELTGVTLLLKSLLSGLDRGTEVPRAAIAELADYVSMSIATTRAIARGLSPVNVERGSLRDALDRLASESGRRLGITVTVREIGGPVVAAEAAGDHLYRIAYEGITNAARHANCSRVDLELRTERETVFLVVRDDGKTPVTVDRDRGGLGLKMMGYRARLLGGSVRLEPAAGGGSCLIATVALAAIRADGEAGKNPGDSRKTG